MPASDNESNLTLKEVQRLHIQRALAAERGNIVRAAVRLGMTRSTLYNKIKTLGINQSNTQDKGGEEKGAAASSSS
jgi:DNA-binding NtrC family response regulator